MLFRSEKQESIHLELFPKVKEYKNKDELNEIWNLFFNIKNDVYKALEEARNNKIIGKSLEAKVYLKLLDEDKEVLKEILPSLKQLLIVSDVVLSPNDMHQYDYCGVEIKKFDGIRCERCWNYFEKSDIIEDICPRCHDVIN